MAKLTLNSTVLLNIDLLFMLIVFPFSIFLLHLSFFIYFSSRKNLPVDTKLEHDGPTDPLTQTDGSPKSHPLSGWTSNKNSAFPDETELQNLLQKLSVHPVEMHRIAGPGDSDSLSSYTSGW